MLMLSKRKTSEKKDILTQRKTRIQLIENFSVHCLNLMKKGR